MKNVNFISALLFVSFTIACEKNINVSVPPYDNKPSIQSMLEPDSIPIVYMNRTVPYFDKKVSFADLVIRNATIKIQSNLGIDSLRLDSVYDRIFCQYVYYYKGTTTVKSNTSYTLTAQIGSDLFTANTISPQLRPTIDSVGYTRSFSDLYGEHEGVIVYFKDIPSQQNYYRYEMVRYIDTSVQKANSTAISICLGKDSAIAHELGRSVYSDQGLSGSQLKIVIEPAYLHKKGTKGQVFLQTFDVSAFNFFDQLDKQKQAQFNPFVEPVFLQPGQFGTKAIGYFSSKINSAPVNFIFPE